MARRAPVSPLLVVSTGCPAGIGPEVAVRAAARLRDVSCVLVGDEQTLRAAAELAKVASRRLVPFEGALRSGGAIYIHGVGPKLAARDRRPGKPSRVSGIAQLAYIDEAFDLTRSEPGRALVTGPVSKAAIAGSGARHAKAFLGHTEWLQARDGAKTSVMCFASQKLVTSLVTTHVPLQQVSKRLSVKGVAEATVWLARLVQALGNARPRIAVCSLNPHAGESELLGNEEARTIVPGMTSARRSLGEGVQIFGPIGAETAFRKALAGNYDAVVAMYHDQATIPMKLVAFGDAVNVTMGLSIVRTSVDHGTAYDIAWQGRADDTGMLRAMQLAAQLGRAKLGV